VYILTIRASKNYWKIIHKYRLTIRLKEGFKQEGTYEKIHP